MRREINDYGLRASRIERHQEQKFLRHYQNVWVKLLAMPPHNPMVVVDVPEPVSHINRQLEFTVGCLQHGVGQMVFRGCQYGSIMVAYLPLELCKQLDPAMLRSFDPSSSALAVGTSAY